MSKKIVFDRPREPPEERGGHGGGGGAKGPAVLAGNVETKRDPTFDKASAIIGPTAEHLVIFCTWTEQPKAAATSAMAFTRVVDRSQWEL